MRKTLLLALAALAGSTSAIALDLQSTTTSGRTVPSLTNGEIAINRADKNLFFKNVDGTIGLGALMNATTAGRQAVEQSIADGLTIGGTALPTLLGAKAPIASPTFTGVVTAPRLSLSTTGSTGDISAMSVTPNSGAAANTLAKLFSDKANVASPTFTGTATVPVLAITGSGSTGDISGMSVGGTALSAALGAKAPLASPTFTGTATIPVLALTGTTSTGEIRGMTVDGVTLSNAFAAKAPTASPVFTGVVAANAVPAVDLTYAGTPNPNTVRYAPGNAVSFCPALSCINGPPNGTVNSAYFDHQRASLLISAQTQLDGQAEEQTLATITTIGTGRQKAWAANTAFALNDNVSVGNATYRATKAGTTGATNPLPTSRPTSLPATYNDGSVTWTWINDQRINGKLGHYNEVNAIAGAGTTWAGVDNLQLNSGVIPSFNVTREVDLTNNSGTDCVINVANCYGLSIFLQGSNYSTAFLDMSSANANNYAALYGILLGGSKSIRDHDISIQSSGAVGVDIGSFGGANHSVASIRDRSTSPSSIDIGGSHTTGIDTNAMTGTYSMLTKAGQKLCFNGTDNCLAYGTVGEAGWQFSRGTTTYATIRNDGGISAAGALSGGSISTGGTIYASGNIASDSAITVPSVAGINQFIKGNADNASFDAQNFRLKIWNGWGLSSYDDVVRGYYDSRNGFWNTLAAPKVNNQDVWYPGNFNPNTKANVAGQTFTGDVAANNFYTNGTGGKIATSVLEVGGLAVEPGAWKSYTPVVTYGQGSSTLFGASATGFYQAIGKTFHFRIRITTGGVSGSDSLNASLPIASKGSASLLAKESAQNFAFHGAVINAGEQRVKIYRLTDLAYPVTAANMVFEVSGTYEAP